MDHTHYTFSHHHIDTITCDAACRSGWMGHTVNCVSGLSANTVPIRGTKAVEEGHECVTERQIAPAMVRRVTLERSSSRADCRTTPNRGVSGSEHDLCRQTPQNQRGRDYKPPYMADIGKADINAWNSSVRSSLAVPLKTARDDARGTYPTLPESVSHITISRFKNIYTKIMDMIYISL